MNEVLQHEVRQLFWFVIGLVFAIVLLTTSMAFAACTFQTIIVNGKIITCTVCYDHKGNHQYTMCN